MTFVKENNGFVNTNLITLKIAVFFTFIGITTVHLLNSVLPFYIGFNFKQYRIITTFIPLISTIGPLIAGPLADRWSTKDVNKFGRKLRLLTSIFLLLSAILYSLLLIVPRFEIEKRNDPGLGFSCNSNGSVLYRENCAEDEYYKWHKSSGDLILENCTYTCINYSNPSSVVNRYHGVLYLDEHNSVKTRYARQIYENSDYSQEDDQNSKDPKQILVEPVHICETKTSKCHVYLDHTNNITLSVTLNGTSVSSGNWNQFTLPGFQCAIPHAQEAFLLRNVSNCEPIVQCNVRNTYDLKNSILFHSRCIFLKSGDITLSLSLYIILRVIASIFLFAALTLINTAIVVAIRETSSGRGEICRQYVWAALAWTLFIPSLVNFKINISSIHLRDIFTYKIVTELHPYMIALTIIISLSFLIAAIIFLASSNMPLSPPEWWWHTKTGMLVYPMSAIRKYVPEISALILITIILGIFWSSIYSYTAWVYKDSIGISYLGCLFVLLLFFNVDRFIEYCGHSNILISVFALYIIRFTGLYKVNSDWYIITTIMEIIEPLYVTVAWITVMLYMRHIIPRKYTASGQAALIICYFCLGKCIGSTFGFIIDETDPDKNSYMYMALAIIALIITFIYFILYDLVLAPRCAAKPVSASQLTLTNISQQPYQQQQQPTIADTSRTNGTTTNNYTPLRVYHNERGKKGQFRY